MPKNYINVIGAGLAGCETAYYLAKNNIKVKLYEMKPKKFTPAHHSNKFAELVCSNSLRSDALSNAVGLLKEEMRRLGSLIMESAEKTKVPAGSALAVDRELFSSYITEKIRSNENIEVIEDEVFSVNPDEITIIATGPLTSDKMADYIEKDLSIGGLHFFDAAAPIVDYQSIDMSKAYFASRYGKGDADYINCPMTKEEYDIFYQELITAKEAEIKEFDKEEQKKINVFEGCMPVEVMAKRGYDTLRFGPLKPVGLPDPKTGVDPYAVVQLRKENIEGTMYNIVGFQTHLTFGEQKRVFGLIPGLQNAEYLRYGIMHRNTYLNSPEMLNFDYSLKSNRNIFFAGQMTGVEGYIESAGSGLLCGIEAKLRFEGKESVDFTSETMIGAMGHYISSGSYGTAKFVPMNANFGIVTPLDHKVKGGKSAKNEEISKRALEKIDSLIKIL